MSNEIPAAFIHNSNLTSSCSFENAGRRKKSYRKLPPRSFEYFIILKFLRNPKYGFEMEALCIGS